ncbi:YlbF family regulator [Bacillaceae bacterium Marseille-Q3522]|nr:YlbF family regulator [Bacillaceae bacterium Marseille-Q3522]
MTTQLHESAQELEKKIRQSDAYSKLKNAYHEVNNDESAKQMFDHFREIQLNLQQKQMLGQEISQEEISQAEKTVALVQQNGKIAVLINAEQRMSELITEMNQIIMKPLEELYGNIQ